MAAVIVGISTFLSVLLIFLLSLRLRQREIETLMKLGASRLRIAGILATEVLLVLCCSGILAVVMTMTVGTWSEAIMRGLL